MSATVPPPPSTPVFDAAAGESPTVEVYSRAQTPDNCTLFPAGDRLIVRRDEAVGMTPGGIALPDVAKDTRTTRGTVMAVGPGKWHPELYTTDDRGNVSQGGYSPMPYSIGDVVLYAKYAGNEVEVAGADYLVLSVADVLVKVVPNGDGLPNDPEPDTAG